MPDDILLSLKSIDFSNLEKFRLNEVVDEVFTTIIKVAAGRLDQIEVFVRVQSEKIGRYAALIVKGEADMLLFGANLNYRLDRLKSIIHGFVEVVEALLVDLVVAVWNGVVKVVWGAISKAIGVELAPPVAVEAG